MKKQVKKRNVILLLFIISTFTAINGQPVPGNGKGANINKNQYGCINFLPDLTQGQIDKIEELNLSNRKDLLFAKTQLQEKHAKLNSLQITENVDIKQVNLLIDEIGKLKTEMLKKQVAHRLEVRKLLTSEQKIIFDEMNIKNYRSGKYKMKHGKGSTFRGRRHGHDSSIKNRIE